MKHIDFLYTSILIVLFNFFSFGQIQEKPKEYTKIKFVYQSKVNYDFDEKGIYGDTIQLKIDIPNKKFRKLQSTTDSTKTIGFIPYKNLTVDEIGHLRSILYHTNVRTEMVYKVKSKKAISKAYFCSDQQTKDIFTNYFGYNCEEIESFRTLIIFKDGKHKVISYSNVVTYKESAVKWIEDMENVGTYEYKTKDMVYTNAIIVDPNLDKHISPIHPFTNCDYGITKVITSLGTTNLISVTYE
ncbi:hypothetical protein [Flavobacterium sp.]|uniref:hypothetical protein n=1 Tax=Flavobacterium sp. TaxID=239 RepID=UPI002B4AC6F1|nr:hypothetical protein [Flavobacterium sp.]HLF52733.1 hypothetical protein [Flavobacterium sp.]